VFEGNWSPVIPSAAEELKLMDMKAGLVEVDWLSFEPWRIQPVRHQLMQHPLLRFEELTGLGKRLERKRCIRSHGNGAEAGTPFNSAPDLHPNARSAVETVQHIETARAWMSLLNVQVDPTYRHRQLYLLHGCHPSGQPAAQGQRARAGLGFATARRRQKHAAGCLSACRLWFGRRCA